jgi:hypothetical protein
LINQTDGLYHLTKLKETVDIKDKIILWSETDFKFSFKEGETMAIDILSLNIPEATLTRSDNTQPVAARLTSEKAKEILNTAKENGEIKDLLQLSGVEQNQVANLKKSSFERKSDYSVSAFFRADMPKQKNADGTYSISGVDFSEEELVKARTVMKAAVDGISAGSGKNSTLDYRNYAEMEIAESSVNQYAKDNFNEEQQKVIAKAMKEYNAGLEELQQQTLSNMNLVDNHYGEISNYYGKSQIADQNLADAINNLKEKISKVTGQSFRKSEAGEVSGFVQTATNTELINNIKSVFSNIDINDEASVAKAMKQYQELVKPVYRANDPTNPGSVNRMLQSDTNAFTQMIEKIKTSQAYRRIDFSI